MVEQMVLFTEAWNLRELGCDVECFMEFYKGELEPIADSPPYKNSTSGKDCVSAPTYSQAFKWLRDEYDITCHIERNRKFKGIKRFDITIDISKPDNFDVYGILNNANTHEECELVALKYLIEKAKELNKVK